MSIGSENATSSRDDVIAKALGLNTATNSDVSDFKADSAELNHSHLPMLPGWSGTVDQEGGRESLTLQATGTEYVNGVDCLVLETTPGSGSWETRWLAQDASGTIWVIRERRGQQLIDQPHLLLPARAEEGWKSWTGASSIPDDYSVISDFPFKVRLQAGGILENCIRLIVHSSEGTRIEYYAEGKGLVRTESP